MIQDVDNTLKNLLVTQMPINPIDSIDVKFDMPNKDWSATITKPTINLFLYDIRENHELRSNDRMLTRSADNTSGAVSLPPVRMDLSYLISVWTTDIADEHQVLGQALNTLLRFPFLPDAVLQGSLQSPPFPVHAWIAQPERLPNPWEFWGHMDHGMKASLNFVLTTSWQPFAPSADPESVVLVKAGGVQINLPSTRPNPTNQAQ